MSWSNFVSAGGSMQRCVSPVSYTHLAARRATKVQTERASLRQWRDAVQEDRLALAERARDLAERQDLEVSCACLLYTSRPTQLVGHCSRSRNFFSRHRRSVSHQGREIPKLQISVEQRRRCV